MTPHFSDPLVTLYLGDCLELMAELEADSVDAIVTDPPYGLEFMGKHWDGPKAWRDDANRRDKKRGREMEMGYSKKIYGSVDERSPAFYNLKPKHLRAFGQWCAEWGAAVLRVTKPGGYLLAFGGTRTHHRLVCALEDAGWIIRDELDWIYASGFPKGKANLKPAHEPIVLARKPGPLRPLAIDECRIEHATINGGNLADNPHLRAPKQRAAPQVTAFGREGDESPLTSPAGRWPSNILLSDPELFDEPNPYVVGSGADARTSGFYEKAGEPAGMWGIASEGSAQYADSGGYSRFFIIPKADRAERERGLAGAVEREQNGSPVRNARCSKCGKVKFAAADARCSCAEPEWVASSQRANSHPTVKPIDLMRHLVRLVTPPGGVVLDPFLGSGTTALAASEEGFRCIGIEREAEYLDIAVGRLMATPMGLGLDVPAGHKPLPKHDGRRPDRQQWGTVSFWGSGQPAGDDLDRIKDPEPLSEWELQWPFPFGDEEPAA